MQIEQDGTKPTVSPTLEIKFSEARAKCVRRTLLAPGFAAEHVSLESGAGLNFRVSGDCHYLALHDVTLSDGEIVVDDLSKIERRDLRNTITFIPKGINGTGWCIPSDRENTFTAIYFKAEDLLPALGKRYSDAFLQPIVYRSDPNLAGTLSKLREHLTSGALDPLYAEALCIAAAIELLGITEADATQGLSAQQLSILYELVEDRIGHPITITELADVVGLSRFHFTRAFKSATGHAPYNYVLQQRISRAKKTLSASATPVEIIASAVGFHSTSQFCRVFKKFVGLTPGAFRASSSR